jgi:hypothetical protein
MEKFSSVCVPWPIWKSSWTANSLLESTLILSFYKARVTGISRSLYIEGFVCHLMFALNLSTPTGFGNLFINRIERIQEKFIKHALRQFRRNVNIDLPPYEDCCRVLVMDTLKKRRDVARVLLVFDLLSVKIDSPKLLSQINLSVPSYRTRARTDPGGGRWGAIYINSKYVIIFFYRIAE